MKEQVALVKTPSYEQTEEGVRKTVELLGGIDKFLQPGMRVLLKPNMLFGLHPDKHVTTHPAVVQAVIDIVKEAGCDPVMGDSPAAGTGTFHSKKAGFRELCEANKVPWISFEDDALEVHGKHAFKKLTIARIAVEADAVINLFKVKTHGQMYLTLAVKNMFGIVPGIRKAQWHMTSGADAVKFAEMLVEVCYLRKPVLNIGDGIIAMDGNGPRNGNPYPLGYVAAGSDPMATDRVVTHLLKVKPSKVPTFKAGENLGMGVTGLDEIEILGGDPADADVRNFKFGGQHLPSDMGKANTLIPFLRKATTSRPVIDHAVCTRCEECVDHCPAEAMELSADRSHTDGKVVIDLDKCIRCYCCSEVCPEGSISVGQGWLWNYLPGFLK